MNQNITEGAESLLDYEESALEQEQEMQVEIEGDLNDLLSDTPVGSYVIEPIEDLESF